MAIKKKKVFKVMATGWKPHKPDHRYASWNRIFGIGAAPPPDSFNRPVPDYIPYQSYNSCCVCCTAAKDQEYGSGLEGHNIQLSFRELYGETPGGTGGRDYATVASRVKNVGLPESSFCPDDMTLSQTQFLDMTSFRTQPLYDNAQIYRLKNYSFVNTNLNSLRSACFVKPIWIAIPGNNADWKKPIDEIITFSGTIEWYHSVLMWDWNSNLYNGILNWWNDRYRKLSTSYPIEACLSTQDLPDNWQQLNKNMEYVIVGTEQYLIYPNLKIAYNIADEVELAKLQMLGLTSVPTPIANIDGYTIYPMVQQDRLKDLFGL